MNRARRRRASPLFWSTWSSALSALAVGCASAPPPASREPTGVSPDTSAAVVVPTRGAPLARHRALLATIRVPKTIAFDPWTLGRNEAPVTITLTNAGSLPVRVGTLRPSFELHKDGVAFPCEPRALDRAEEAGTLHPGDSFTVSTTLGCWTPLTGRYTGRAFVAFGAEATVAEEAGELAFDVIDPAGRSGRPDAARPGLSTLR